MKLGRNVCLDEISCEFENRSHRVRNYVNMSKNLVYAPETDYWSDIHESWSECLPR